MAHLVIEPTSRLSASQIDQIRQIYLQSFPAEERTDFDTLISGVSHGRPLLFLAQTSENGCIGFCTSTPLARTNVLFLGYLAVHPEFRNQQVGSKMLATIKRYAHENGLEGLILEAEPEDEGTDEERVLRRRRIGLYQRNGFHIVQRALDYRMPLLSGEGSLRMRLLWMPLDHSPLDLSGPRLQACIQEIYADIYHRTGDDPLLKTILDSLY